MGRDLIRAEQPLKIEVLDHVIVGKPNHRNLRELGYFCSAESCQVTGVVPQYYRGIAPFFYFSTRTPARVLLSLQRRKR